MTEDAARRDVDVPQLTAAEYASLREEILKLVELQFQHVGLTVASLGTVMTVGLGTRSAPIVLVHPLLSLILFLSWFHHTSRIHRIASYIRVHVERRVGLEAMSWEHYVQRHPLPHGRASYVGLRAAFPFSSLLSLGTSLTVASRDAQTYVLFGLALACTTATCLAFFAWREPAPEARPLRHPRRGGA
ncbi:hypothetical protein [Streptomyces hoynatensis]|uniref:Uncharacterized protein n=1 Tax=Streptomyces hoynatensis TaxID=1141874 RepID=A0A3A9ZF79_9ACTN|nr:hypothetical protein [Streptomyces hoynatensis]RKN46953.1 hypothetical protein D7294_01785 [Streptomyces hoynatensis]